MTKKVAALMNQIDEVLAETNQDSADVWNLLTALRGPDDHSLTMDKRSTTSVLRAKLFPKMYAATEALWRAGFRMWPPGAQFFPAANKNTLLPDVVEVRRVEGFVNTHAVRHFNEALKAFRREDSDGLPNPAQQPDVPGAEKSTT